MKADNLKSRRSDIRQKRKSKEMNLRAETWLLICEGKETEPKYFEKLIEYANSKSEIKIKYKIEGLGRNTESLVSSIDNYFSFVDSVCGKENIPYGKVFAIFDKDSFKKDQFNNAIFTAESKGYVAIWSNECFELWFLLHFNYMSSNITRQEYFDKLTEKFGQVYSKTDNHFDLLDTENRLRIAMKNSKSLYDEFEHEKSFSKKAPCTTVFKFVEEIESYIGKKIS